MKQPGEILMVEPCDICGDVGFPEAIVTCSKCNIIREHVYCMRIYLTEIPEDWLCEICLSKNGTASPCKMNQDFGLETSKRQRAVPSGKVKFLNEDEVIKLSSGNFPASSTMLMTHKASVRSKNVISKIPSLTLKSNPHPSMVLGKLPRVHKNQMTDQHASCSLLKGPTKEHRHVSPQRRLGALIPDKKVQALDRQIEKPTKGAPCEASLARKASPIVGSGDVHGAIAECNKSSIEKRSIQENFDLHRKHLPSANPVWSGPFRILPAAGSWEFYDGLEAQPPCIVNSKAYKFSNRLPSILQLESLPAMNVLTDVFQNDSPRLQDIALYFVPSDNTERSRKNLNNIFKFMNAENSMLRSSIDGVELLVFTSNHLDRDSRGNRPLIVVIVVGIIAATNSGSFLWGVFRRNKNDKAVERLPEMEPVDMDIDMIGGKDVEGRVDHVLKNKSRSLSKWPLDTLLQNTSKKVEKKTLINPSHLKHLCVRDESVLSEELKKKTKSGFSSDPTSRTHVKEYSKSMGKLDAPPGFKAPIYRSYS